ncbi:hypothetical protein AOQ84DRAFT_404936 [Glonium stellatum]|uniref:Methyltransferase n=1 Tax=Glonium stellatum TaxID=574774 RepID=A0A8E2F2S6_9PEZI|nr:hypothetical protein AOQ84DRAFT_404936 [Glonium stellatum]
MLATLKFLSDLPLYDLEKPYELCGFPEVPQSDRSNCQFTDHNNIKLEDVRGQENKYSINDYGFAFVNHTSSLDLKAQYFEHQNRNDAVVNTYLKECIELVKREIGADRVVCIDWRLRRNFSERKTIYEDDPRYFAIPPASVMHCDFSEEGGREKLHVHLPSREVAESIRKGQRVQFFNVWRPLHPVDNAPLVLCDRRSVRRSDLLEADKVSPGLIERDSMLKYDTNQKWYWLSNQQPDEVTLFKSWDSCNDENIADCAPHGSAKIPVSECVSRPRESLEVRLIVLFNEG